MFQCIDMGLPPLSGGAAHNVIVNGNDIVSGADQQRHSLFDELDACSPRWQKEYRTLRDAAYAYGLRAEFEDFLRTDDGARYQRAMAGVRDWLSVSEYNRRQREAELAMAAGARGGVSDE